MDPFFGQIQAFAFNFPPRGWQTCSGQLLPIATNQALFALLGTYYGGDGRTSFALPDLRGRTIVGMGEGPGLSNIIIGETGGAEQITLATSNMPAHMHLLNSASVQTVIQTVDNTNESSDSNNGGNVLGTSGSMPSIYRESASGNDHLGGVTSTISGMTSVIGSSMPFDSRSPFLGMNYCIAVEGIFPPRD